MPPEAQPWYWFFPHVNAALNATAAVLIGSGLIAIKRGQERLHKNLMLAAFAVSAAFLACYLTYHLSKTAPVTFRGEGPVRTVYLAILSSHIVLAVVQLPLIVMTILLGLRATAAGPEASPGIATAGQRSPIGRGDLRARHRRWAKVTAPMWLYVSVTGVVVYVMLYRW
jgi:uncharacterized membrane protein YozB (DUF420 family)